jgi:hydrogenase maturation factor HypE
MKTFIIKRGVVVFLFLETVLFFSANSAFSQTPVPLKVTATQAINFGAFCLIGNQGGTVTVGWDGNRTSSGDVRLLSGAHIAKAAIYEIELCPGGNVTVSFDATTTLTDDKEVSLTLDIGPTERGLNNASFATNSECSVITTLRVGGTLHIPGTATPGIFSGNFEISITQE